MVLRGAVNAFILVRFQDSQLIDCTLIYRLKVRWCPWTAFQEGRTLDELFQCSMMVMQQAVNLCDVGSIPTSGAYLNWRII